MDYIRQLNSFKIHRTVKPIGPMAISLYLALFELDNELGFAEWFCSTFGRLSESAGGLTEKQFYRARNELLQNGYIEYRKSSTPRKAGHYRLIPLDDCEALSIDERKANDSPMIDERKANDSIKQTKTKLKPNETEKESGAHTRQRSTVSVPPTVEEVGAYCEERRNGVDPVRFVDFYASKGWYVGKNKMRDWKAAVRTWEKREQAASPDVPDKPKEVQTFGVTV